MTYQTSGALQLDAVMSMNLFVELMVLLTSIGATCHL